MFVDYAGATIPVQDLQSDAVVSRAAVFVAVAGRQQLHPRGGHYLGRICGNWIGSHMRAFEFFGGVVEVVVPDNLKSAVTHPVSYYEPELNPTYRDLWASIAERSDTFRHGPIGPGIKPRRR